MAKASRTMHIPFWQVENHCASLCMERLSGSIDLSRPGNGITRLSIDGQPLDSASLFQIAQGAAPLSTSDVAQVDHYVRGADLVATYEETDSRRLRAQLYWRAPRSSMRDVLGAIELIASVQTSLLESDPLLTVQSVLPTAEVSLLKSAADVSYQQVRGPAATNFDFRSHGKVCCFLVRPSGASWSYAEMVHPLDAQSSRVEFQSSSSGPSSNMVLLQHRLFEERIEKGVILRARVWGLFLPRDGDLAAAAAHYRAFAAQEPPLST
jgi:hypothetical protein